MSSRGRGRGRFGRGGYVGRGGYPRAKPKPFELFPEIAQLGTASYSTENVRLRNWSANLQKYWQSSLYYYEDKRKSSESVHKPDIERHSDKSLQATKAKPPLWHYIKLDADHVPAELAMAGGRKRVKRVIWNPESDTQKVDEVFEKLGKEHQDEEEKEEEEEEVVEEVDDGEFSDEGDYEQAEYFDDDEDDFNMPDDNDDEPCF